MAQIPDHRSRFCAWYTTPVGQKLQNMEVDYLTRVLRVGYNQRVLQAGSLGWEERFLEVEWSRNFTVVDRERCEQCQAAGIIANLDQLPIESESIDTAIMPHTLEFTDHQHQVLREVERVLKPEGHLLLLGFNPWSIFSMYHYLPGRWKQVPWCGNFISRRRVLDWLSLLNFETELSAGFYFKSSSMVSDMFEGKYSSVTSMAYAIKAIKRRYTLIPLKPVWNSRPCLCPDLMDASLRNGTNG